jgi:glycosyltransferase involved in cell wall biosynthesis
MHARDTKARRLRPSAPRVGDLVDGSRAHSRLDESDCPRVTMNTTDGFRVSVVIPCRNAGPWVGRALESAARQSLAPYEIVVIDDDSADDSVAEIARSGVPVTLLHVAAHNAAAARNAGITAATGDWIAFLDADDVWYPNHLARACELLSTTGDVAFMSNHDWIDLAGAVVPIPETLRCKLSAPRSRMSVDDFYLVQRDGLHFGHSTVVYRRDRVVELGMFDVTQVRRHDLDLWLRMIASGTWAYDTINGAGYREATPHSISTNELECDYYDLRALVKNIDVVKTPLHRESLARQARRAMGIAFADAPADHYARIRELAWPYLSWPYRLYYRLGAICPPLFRGLIRAKRTGMSAWGQTRRRLAAGWRTA